MKILACKDTACVKKISSLFKDEPNCVCPAAPHTGSIYICIHTWKKRSNRRSYLTLSFSGCGQGRDRCSGTNRSKSSVQLLGPDNLMSPINDVIVQQLLLIVLGGGHLLVPQPSVLPDFLQGVVLQQAAVLKHSHQEILTQRTRWVTHQTHYSPCIFSNHPNMTFFGSVLLSCQVNIRQQARKLTCLKHQPAVTDEVWWLTPSGQNVLYI